MRSIQIVGPFFTNYSLARINRGLAVGLSKLQTDYKVKLFGEKESIDYYPSDEDLNTKPRLKELFSKEKTQTDIAIYDNFPKSITNLHGLKDLPGKTKIIYVAWEESVYPEMWVKEINENAHIVMAMSTFTKEILQNSGVRIPTFVVPGALDDDLFKPNTTEFKIETNKKFKFLHISTAKKRKGVDVLLKAYFEEFTKDDDVTLIIKSFPGPDNEVDKLLNELKTENSPEVVHINNPDLTEAELRSLHMQSDCEVYPTRAEGFGLTILEAMYFGKPVIVTNYSSHLDFCNEETAMLIDYKLDYATDSELVNVGARWAEPSVNSLKQLMKKVFSEYGSEEIKTMVAKAKAVAEIYTWENSAKKALEVIRTAEELQPLKEKKLGVITTINDEGGISDYCWDLYKSVQASFKNFYFISNSDIADRTEDDEENVIRNWTIGENNFEKTIEFIKKENLDIVHIQYHSGSFYPPEALDILISRLKELNIEVIVTLHAVRSKNFDFIEQVKNLNKADKVLIHNQDDFEYAKTKLQNAELFTHFNIEFKKRTKVKEGLGFTNSLVIATHGLLNTNKGIPEVINAAGLIKNDHPDVLLLCLNAVSSNNIMAGSLLEQCKQIIKDKGLESNVRFFTDFLKDELIEVLLQASDIVVFNYSDVGESASAAVRKGLASLKPVILTDIKQFKEFTNECYIIPDNNPESIHKAVKEILENKDLQKKLLDNTKAYIEKNNVEKKAVDTLKLYIIS